MLTKSFWRRFSGRHRRHKRSFYDSQHLMREAAQADMLDSLRYLNDEDLQGIIDAEGGTRRAEIARSVLEGRKGNRGGTVGGSDSV